jgi:hypothetical protein
MSMKSSVELSMAIEGHGLGQLKGIQYFNGLFHGTVNGNTGAWHLTG